jgi:hypothetical protein
MVTLVRCANSYTLLFLCPIIYLNHFWCIKYQHTNIYMKMGKRNGKRKRKGNSCSLGRGVISAHPGASAAGGPLGPSAGETVGNGAVARAQTSAGGGGVNGAARATEGGESTGARPPVKSRGGSPPWVRFCGGGRGSRGWGQFDRRRPRVAGPRRGGGRSRR